MPTIVSCPTCSTATTFREGPTNCCPKCGERYPAAIYSAATFAYAGLAKPIPLAVGSYVAAFLAAMSLLVLMLASFGIGTYTIDDETVNGPAFLQTVGWLLVVHAALLSPMAYALFRDRPWSRPLIVLYWLASGLTTVAGGQHVGCGVLEIVVLAGLAAWYLYGNQKVAAYYAMVKRGEHTRPS
jgi:hypothetical protein